MFFGFAKKWVTLLDFLINAPGGTHGREGESCARLHEFAIVLPDVGCAANFVFGRLVWPVRFRGDTTIKRNYGIGVSNNGGFVRSVRLGFF